MVNCRYVSKVGRHYWMVWSITVSAQHYHRFQLSLTEEEYNAGLQTAKASHRDVKPICETCGQAFEDPHPAIGVSPIWNTEDGKLHPGDIFWADYLHWIDDQGAKHCPYWDNCTDPRGHLAVVMPDNTQWDSSGRAANCANPQDRQHRCWILTGEPPNVTVTGSGCGGSYSIQSPGWHGHLINGTLVA